MSEHHDTTHVHVTSIPLLVAVFCGLIAGTWLTVAVTYVDLGALNIWIGLAIATAKAILVALFFMHLRWDKPFNLFLFLVAIGFLMIFIGIAMLDSGQYAPGLIPGYSPGMTSAAP